MQEYKPESDLERKISPIIDSAMARILGVKIDELNKDITDRLKKRPTLNLKIDVKVPFSKAKNDFKRSFLIDLLMKHHANVSDVARVAKINRRTIHRLVSPSTIVKIRHDMPRPAYVKAENISLAIEEVLDHYRQVIHPDKFREVYASVPTMSKDLLEYIEEPHMTLDEAEIIFEKEYLAEALKSFNNNLKLTAQKIRLRYETVLRKVKEYDLK